MQPRVTKRERKLSLNYHLPHRIHCTEIYPALAPNGSTLVVYGHDNGLKVLWRGGRRRAQRSESENQNNGGVASVSSLRSHGLASDSEFEIEDDEVDPDCPYTDIIEDLDVSVGSEVFHIAAPNINDISVAPDEFHDTVPIAVASTDGAIVIIRIPLAPPPVDQKHLLVDWIGRTQIALSESGPVPTSLALKIAPIETGRKDAIARLLVAHTTQNLLIHTVDIAVDGSLAVRESPQLVPLPFASRQLSFQPSPRNSQILVVDISGSLRILDLSSSTNASDRPGSSDSSFRKDTATPRAARWVVTLHAPFQANGSGTGAHAILSRRKQILDAKYVLGGKRILALLEDGEWGIWDLLSAPAQGKQFGEFALRGYLTSSPAVDSTDNLPKPQRGFSKLAPTTPNTRKAKAATLFTGTPKPVGAASRGGISVSANHVRNGPSDESVVVWYGADLYAIPSILSFCQRSTNSDGSFGSLYAPGLAHISDIHMHNENITAVAQFTPDSTATNFGQMNVQRDILVAAEYQAIIMQTTKPPTPAKSLFQKALTERPASRDQHMLDAGELDLGGMDRLLDSMADRPRRVGFAE